MGLGILFSFLFPGMGHAYVGRTVRGAIWLGPSIALTVAIPWLGFWALVGVILIRVFAPIDFLIVARARRLAPPESNVMTITGAFALVSIVPWVLLRFFVEAFKIPSGGMVPALHPGDHVLVSRVGVNPRRGDLVVFQYPPQPEKKFVKRVIALGGDTIAVKSNQPIVNGKPAAHRTIAEGYTYWDMDESIMRWEKRTALLAEETLDGRSYPVLPGGDERAPYDFPPLEGCARVRLEPVPDDLSVCRVPAGHYFMLGDNRSNSHDSRYWGAVPDSDITGRVTVVWWSSGSPDGFRWDRLGRVE